MSLVGGGGVSLFPLEFLKKCVETYTKDHGKKPKLLVVSKEDYIDYTVSGTIAQANQLDLEITYGDYLKSGEFDLALGIKEKKSK